MTDAKPYTLAEAIDLGTSHYGASVGRVRATVEALERAEAALAAVTAERDRMREALVNLEDGAISVELWSERDGKVAAAQANRMVGVARAALATPPAPASMPLADPPTLYLKFNGGDAVFLWDGSGSRKLSEFDLFTRTEVEAYGVRVAEAVRSTCLAVWGGYNDESRDVDLAAVVKEVK